MPMSGPFPDPPPSGIPPTSRASFSSGRSRSSSTLPSDSRRPSNSSQGGIDPYSPPGSRQQSFSSTNGALPSPGSALSGAGLIFPGPAQGGRPALSPHQSGGHDEEQESLSPSMRQNPASPFQPYFPGPPSSATRRDYLERAAAGVAPDAAQYPLPQSRQHSIDSNIGASDIPTFSMPFPPPPPTSAAYSRAPASPSPLDARTHLGSGLHKTQSSSSLSGQSQGNASAYSYDAASPSPIINGRGPTAAAVEPSPNPSISSSAYGGLDAAPPPPPSSGAGSYSVGDFDRRGEGLGLGRGIMDSGIDTRRPSLAPTVSGGGGGGAGGSYGAGGVSDAETVGSAPGPGGYPGAYAGAGAGAQGQEDVVPTGFDEGVLRALCDMDCGMPLLLERMKQSMASCREASTFLKKRAQIEEEYARSMAKLARLSIESYSVGDGKAGSYVSSWLSLLRTHELLGENRLKFAAQLSEMSDELAVLGKEVEKSRKATKDLGARLEKGLQEQEGLVDKARIRFDSAAEELERLLLLKQGETITPSSLPHAGASGSNPSKGRSFGKAMSKLKGPKNAAQFARQEEDVRSRMGQSSDAYRAQVAGAQSVRQEYFNLQLPRILRSLKESVDELDLGTQYHLSRYAYLFESLLVTDGLTVSPVSPEDGPGIKSVVDVIDIREDFKTFMQQFALNWQMSGQRGPRREGPADEGFPSRPSLSPNPSSNNLQSFSSIAPPAAPTRPTFGVDLGEQMARDNVDVPRVLEKCAEAIELHGLDSMGIYRLSGTTSRVQRLKAALDRDLEGTDLLSEENLTDINDIAAVLKLWFRELPEPLLTWELYHQFIEVAKIENDRLRHIRLHERVNDLPDPNYATLKFLMGHLDKVAQRESVNQMSVSNLAIVFGPNLLGAPPPHLAQHYAAQAAASAGGDPNGAMPAPTQGGGLADMQHQCKAVETILLHFQEIFVE
ncbi:Rho GTPase-activating protein [Rhodotorula kratochvilovae]